MELAFKELHITLRELVRRGAQIHNHLILFEFISFEISDYCVRYEFTAELPLEKMTAQNVLLLARKTNSLAYDLLMKTFQDKKLVINWSRGKSGASYGYTTPPNSKTKSENENVVDKIIEGVKEIALRSLATTDCDAMQKGDEMKSEGQGNIKFEEE